MAFETINLWFAKSEDGQTVTINDVDKTDSKKYYCPICGSEVISKQGDIMSWHFAHIDKSKCSSEQMIHFWVKNELLKIGESFSVKVGNDIVEYICDSIEVEKIHTVNGSFYKPDITINTKCGAMIFFEINNKNEKKPQDYMDKWTLLNNTVVEVSVSELLSNTKQFTAIFSDNICYKKMERDKYTSTIGNRKETILKSEKDIKKAKDRVVKLDWFWTDMQRHSREELSSLDLINTIWAIEDETDYVFVMDQLKTKACTGFMDEYISISIKMFIDTISKNDKYNLFECRIDEGKQLKNYTKKSVSIKSEILYTQFYAYSYDPFETIPFIANKFQYTNDLIEMSKGNILENRIEIIDLITKLYTGKKEIIKMLRENVDYEEFVNVSSLEIINKFNIAYNLSFNLGGISIADGMFTGKFTGEVLLNPIEISCKIFESIESTLRDITQSVQHGVDKYFKDMFSEILKNIEPLIDKHAEKYFKLKTSPRIIICKHISGNSIEISYEITSDKIFVNFEYISPVVKNKTNYFNHESYEVSKSSITKRITDFLININELNYFYEHDRKEAITIAKERVLELLTLCDEQKSIKILDTNYLFAGESCFLFSGNNNINSVVIFNSNKLLRIRASKYDDFPCIITIDPLDIGGLKQNQLILTFDNTNIEKPYDIILKDKIYVNWRQFDYISNISDINKKYSITIGKVANVNTQIFLNNYNFVHDTHELSLIYNKIVDYKKELAKQYNDNIEENIFLDTRCEYKISSKEIDHELYQIIYPIISQKHDKIVLNIKFTTNNNGYQPWLINDFIEQLRYLGFNITE